MMQTPPEPRATRIRRPGRWLGLVVGLMLLLTALNRLTVPSVAADGKSQDDALNEIMQLVQSCVQTGGVPDADYDELAGWYAVTCTYGNHQLICVWYYPEYVAQCVQVLTRPPQPHGGTQVRGIGAVMPGTTAPPTPPSSVVPPGTSSGLSQQPVVAASPSPSATPVTGTPPIEQSNGAEGQPPASPGLTGPVTTLTGQNVSSVDGVMPGSAPNGQPPTPTPSPAPGQGGLTSATAGGQAAAPSAPPAATPPA